MAQPSSASEWIGVAAERQADAKAMLARANSNGPLYMSGWSVECGLNAFLMASGVARPRWGGHDLRQLWNAAGLSLHDLNDNGYKGWFLENWGTHLRYETVCDRPGTNDELVSAAGQILGYLSKRSRRARRWR